MFDTFQLDLLVSLGNQLEITQFKVEGSFGDLMKAIQIKSQKTYLREREREKKISCKNKTHCNFFPTALHVPRICILNTT